MTLAPLLHAEVLHEKTKNETTFFITPYCWGSRNVQKKRTWERVGFQHVRNLRCHFGGGGVTRVCKISKKFLHGCNPKKTQKYNNELGKKQKTPDFCLPYRAPLEPYNHLHLPPITL